jgi:hypothetical protein
MGEDLFPSIKKPFDNFAEGFSLHKIITSIAFRRLAPGPPQILHFNVRLRVRTK